VVRIWATLDRTVVEAGEQVEAFATCARRFCGFVAEGARLSLAERMLLARELLAELFSAACHLPGGDGNSPYDASDLETAVPSDWPGFAEYDSYRDVFDPYDDASAVMPSLSDDVLDIHRELTCGLRAFDAGQVDVAVWEWRFGFDHHWGRHAVGALRALHAAITSHGPSAPGA
jgi:Domain of unknown function (DUF5063)